VRRGVAVQVHGRDPHLDDPSPGLGGPDQQVELVLETVAGHGEQPREHLGRVPAQTRLGVMDATARGEREQLAGHGVAEPRSQRDPAGEPACAQDRRPGAGLVVRRARTLHAQAPGDGGDVVRGVLTVAVRAHDVLPGQVRDDEGEAGAQGHALAPVPLVGRHGGSRDRAHRVEDGRKARAGAVVDHHHAVGGAAGDEHVDQGDEPPVGLVGGDQDDHGSTPQPAM